MLIARQRAAAARDRPVPLPPAQGLRRHGARFRRRRRHSGGARARLSVDGLERRQPRLPPLDPRLLRPRNPARGVGRQPRRADRVLHRARRRARRARPTAGSSSRAAGRSPPASTIRTGTCSPSPSTATTARRRSTGGCAWCRSPTTRSSTPGTPWAWAPPAARTSRSPTCSCPSAAPSPCRAAAAGSSIPAPRSTPARSSAFRSSRPPATPLAPAALGAAEGAYELFLASMAKRAGTYTGAKVADFQAVQIKVARARCLIDSARQVLRQSAIAFQAPPSATRSRTSPPSCASAPSGLRRQPGARGGGDAVVLLRRAGPLHPRSPAAPPARRHGHRTSTSPSTSTSPAPPSASTRSAAPTPTRRCKRCHPGISRQAKYPGPSAVGKFTDPIKAP